MFIPKEWGFHNDRDGRKNSPLSSYTTRLGGFKSPKIHANIHFIIYLNFKLFYFLFGNKRGGEMEFAVDISELILWFFIFAIFYMVGFFYLLFKIYSKSDRLWSNMLLWKESEAKVRNELLQKMRSRIDILERSINKELIKKEIEIHEKDIY